MNLSKTMDELFQSFANEVKNALASMTLQDLVEAQGSHLHRFTKSVKKNGSGKRIRRDPGALMKFAERIAKLVRKKPMGAEAIKLALGVEKKELPKPIALGLQKKLFRKKGEKRSTIYFVAEAKRAKRAKKPKAPKAVKRVKTNEEEE